ncbi:hypothetical protein ACQUW5_04995 [Legionella sp. CNM-1927-20]|uniref:hypothetical protein n=1 Tax=Legionella sp. CNM-1927-20 TaxID=3422221 RepID=UPI00403A8E8D
MTNNRAAFENEKEKVNNLYENSKHKAEAAYQQGEKKLNDAIEQGKEKSQDFYHQAKESASDFYNESKKMVNEAKDYLQANSDEIINAVKEKPLSSLLIAGGVGFILYNLLRR